MSHYICELNEKVERVHVRYQNRYGIMIAGDLYTAAGICPCFPGNTLCGSSCRSRRTCGWMAPLLCSETRASWTCKGRFYYYKQYPVYQFWTALSSGWDFFPSDPVHCRRQGALTLFQRSCIREGFGTVCGLSYPKPAEEAVKGISGCAIYNPVLSEYRVLSWNRFKISGTYTAVCQNGPLIFLEWDSISAFPCFQKSFLWHSICGLCHNLRYSSYIKSRPEWEFVNVYTEMKIA